MEKKTIMDDVATENVNVELPQIENPIVKPKRKKRRNRKRRITIKNQWVSTSKNITFCNTVGIRGVFILSLVLGTATLHFIALFVYTRSFTYMRRDGIWIFFFFFIVFSLLLIYLLISWKRLTRNWIRRNYDDNNMMAAMRRINNNPIQYFRRLYSNTIGNATGRKHKLPKNIVEKVEKLNFGHRNNLDVIY